MVAYCFGNAPPFSYQATGQRQLGRAVQPAHLRGWRSAHSTCRQRAAPLAAANGQGSEAGDGSHSSGSGGRHGSSRGINSSSSGSRSSGDISSHAKVDTILASAGLNPAELQQHDPLAFSLLTVPLARVLAEVHLNRVTTKARLFLHPAQLMARICFLAYDVGLTAEQIRARHGQNTDGLRFDLDGARQLLAWLRSQHVSNSQLKIASMANTQLWATDVGAAQRSKQHVQQCLGVTNAQWAEAFHLQSKGFAARPEVLDGVVAWLESEPLGYSSAEVRQLWQSIPQLFISPAATLQHNPQRLLSRCPFSKQQLRSFMRGRSSLLHLDPEGLLGKLDSLVAELPGLEPGLAVLLAHGGTALNLEKEVLLGKISSLLDYGFSKQQLAKVLSTNTMALSSSWDGKLQPVLAALEGALGGRQSVVAAVSKAPDLLGIALVTIDDNLRVLRAAGLSPDEVRCSISKQPQLFSRAYVSPEFQAKLRYFDEVLGIAPRLIFLNSPTYLKSSLRLIDYTVSFMQHQGSNQYCEGLSWICSNDAEFCQRCGFSLEEFKGWEVEWLQSERAREYGLTVQAESMMGKRHAARQRGRKASVAARRQRRLAGEAAVAAAADQQAGA